MNKSNNYRRVRLKRKIRKRVFGTAEIPRLSVFRSNRSISAQLIDDTKGFTIASVFSKQIINKTINKDIAFKTGQELAKVASKKDIVKVVFDRNSYAYHGRVKSLADGSREGGLKF